MVNKTSELVDYFTSEKRLEPEIKEGIRSSEWYLRQMLRVSKALYQEDKPLEVLKYYCAVIDHLFKSRSLVHYHWDDPIRAALPCKQYSDLIMRIYSKTKKKSNAWVEMATPVKTMRVQEWMDTGNLDEHVKTHVKFFWSMACACDDHTLALGEEDKNTLQEFRKRSKDTLLYLKDILRMLGWTGSVVL